MAVGVRTAIYTPAWFVDYLLISDVLGQRCVRGSNRSGTAHDGQGKDMKVVGDAHSRFPKQGFFLVESVLAERGPQLSGLFQCDQVRTDVLDLYQLRFQPTGHNQPRVPLLSTKPPSYRARPR